jgi:hypothetical protein
MDQVRLSGIAWFRRDSFDEMRAMFEDGGGLPATYNAWLSGADSKVRQLEMRGIRVVKAVIEPDSFPEWCEARGMKIDSRARTHFANWTARQAAK